MANNLDLALNRELNRWELHFMEAPEKDLSDYLVRLGYRFSQRKPRLYYAPHQNAYKMFGEELKEALQTNENYLSIVIKPSHIPNESNLIHNKFSYVTISYKKSNAVDKENFVIFDQYKKIAEAIGHQYAEPIYGDTLISVEATPRVAKKAARKLLEKNKVINPLAAMDIEIPKKNKNQESKVKTKRKKLTNDHGVYTKETAGDRLEIIEIPIPAAAKFDAIISIIYDENDKYRFATSTHKNFGDHSGGSSSVSTSSSIYKTREEVLLLAFQEIVSTIHSHIDQRDAIISDQNKKNSLLNKALKATLKFAKELNVDVTVQGNEEKADRKKRETDAKEKRISTNKRTKYSNQKGAYTEETAGDRLEKIQIPIPKSSKYEASITIIEDENELYRYGLHVAKGFGDYNGWYKGVSTTSDIFKTRKEALRAAFKSIVSKIQYHIEHEDPILTNQELKNKKLTKALTATLEFAKKLDIVFEAGKVKNKENKENKKVNSKKEAKKQNQEIGFDSLFKIVSSVSEQLQDLADQTEGIGDRVLIETERIQFNDALEITSYKILKEDLERILKEQEFWIKKIRVLIIKEKYVGILNQLTKVLGIPLLEVSNSSRYIIVQKWTTLTADMLGRFQELIDTNPDNLHFTYLPSAKGVTEVNMLNILCVTIASDRDKIIFSHRKASNELVIHSLMTIVDTMVEYSGQAIPMGKLKSAIRYMIAHPETLKVKPYTIAPYDNLHKVVVRAIEKNGVKTPNVLIPKGVVNTIFEAGDMEIEKASEYANRFPKLFALTDKTLGKANAKQLFSLAQIYEPEAYGLKLQWKSLYDYWQANGEEIFKQLGYPIDSSYPYVDVTSEDTEIKTLGNILMRVNWLSLAQSYRPIANMEKATTILDKKIDRFIIKRIEYIDPDTGMPKKASPNGEIYNSLSSQIQNLRAHKDIIQAYQLSLVSTPNAVINENELNAKKKQFVEQEKTDVEEPLNIPSNDQNYTVKTIHSFGRDIPNIRIPNKVPIPFDEGGILANDVKGILKQYPKLSKINNKTIKEASALELFQLAQLDISKLKIHKDLFHNEWMMRGESIFSELDFPMDLNYPYVSTITGYFNVERLANILEKNKGLPSWLWAAKEFRPIAFPDTGIITINLHITKFEKELKELQKKQENADEKRDKIDDEIKNTSRILDELEASKKVISDYITFQSNHKIKKEKIEVHYIEEDQEEGKRGTDFIVVEPKIVVPPDPLRLISEQDAKHIRKQFKTKGFTVYFTGKQAFTQSISISELGLRYRSNQVKLEEKIEKEFHQWIGILEKEIKALEGKEDRKSKQSKIHRLERISSLKRESEVLELLVVNEDTVFRDELFMEVLGRVKDKGYVIREDSIADFRNYLMTHLFEGRFPENYPDQSLGKTVRILVDDYFSPDTTMPKENNALDYLDKVIAIMHDHYMDAKRLSKKQVEALKAQAGVPNFGMLWEAVELSWLLWYKFYYQEPVSFENRLGAMIRFWNTVQPTYAYSDSSKEQYKQYSTPCPIGAIIAEYTEMSTAESVFEPSAGNGLLVLGADPKKTHVNEIDSNRRHSLEAQGFKTITHHNAAEPFPKEVKESFDVMVTNPPFASWDADSFDKDRIIKKYFNSYRRLENNRLRLEHVMSGLGLYTLKSSGKAALIIMGHLYFDDNGYIAKARPFFNWLYMHYRVDDIINLNSFKLYNKQGAVAKTMLILISGRKRNPSNTSIAPTRKEASNLDMVVNTFEELWSRVKSSIKSPLEIVIQKLKIENGYDIL